MQNSLVFSVNLLQIKPAWNFLQKQPSINPQLRCSLQPNPNKQNSTKESCWQLYFFPWRQWKNMKSLKSEMTKGFSFQRVTMLNKVTLRCKRRLNSDKTKQLRPILFVEKHKNFIAVIRKWEILAATKVKMSGSEKPKWTGTQTFPL